MKLQAGTAMRLTIKGYDESGESLLITDLDGCEALNDCFRFVIDLHVRRDDLRLSDVVDRQASLTLFSRHPEQGEDIPMEPRQLHGVISDAELKGRHGQDFLLQVVFSPRALQLDRCRRSRVFMLASGQTVPDIIEQVLKDHQFEPGTDFSLANLDKSSYPTRDYVVQYEESDFAFIKRWCEHEGIWFHFEHGSVEKLVFGDSKDHYVDLAAAGRVPFKPEGGAGSSHGNAGLFSIGLRRTTIPDAVVVQDYNWRDNTWRDPAGSMLLSKQTAAGSSLPADLERHPRLHHSFDTYYDVRDEGQWLLQRRVDGFDARWEILRGNSSCFSFAPGCSFQPANCQAAGLDEQPYLLTEVVHRGRIELSDNTASREGSYGNAFTAILGERQFRPERRSTWPAITGVMHATVDGSRCDDIALDESDENPYALAEISPNGEYRVRLPFDLAGKPAGAEASCWMRMAQPHSGKDYGMHFPLHVGCEVLLSHIDGNPDRPVIVGTIPSYHTASPVNANNSHQNVVRTASGHQLVFDDLYDTQRIVIENGKNTVFEMYGRDFTTSNEFKANPSAANADGEAPIIAAPETAPTRPYRPGHAESRNHGAAGFTALGDDGLASAGPEPAHDAAEPAPADAPAFSIAVPASAQHALGRGGKETLEEQLTDYQPRVFPDERFFDHFRIVNEVTHLDFGSDTHKYVEKDFLDTFRIIDREQYLPTNVDPDPKNHEEADETRRDAITKPRELKYLPPASKEKGDPNLQCMKYTGSIGWQWVNCGPEVGLQYGRVNKRTEGDVFTYHRGDRFHSHELGDYYEFCQNENRYSYRSGNDHRFGGGYELRNTVNEDLAEERFINNHKQNEITFTWQRVESSTKHQDLCATETWEQGIAAHSWTSWKTVTDTHLDYVIATTAQTMIDADQQTAISGQYLLHTGHDLQEIVGGDHLLNAVNSNVELTGQLSVLNKSTVFSFASGFTIKESKAGKKPKPDKPEGTLSQQAEKYLTDGQTAVDEAYKQAEKSDSYKKPDSERKQEKHDARSPSGGGSGIGMEASKIQAKSKGTYIADAGGAMTLKTKAALKAEGATITISGKSKIDIKAGTIHIG